jgi:hypothetical protein
MGWFSAARLEVDWLGALVRCVVTAAFIAQRACSSVVERWLRRS